MTTDASSRLELRDLAQRYAAALDRRDLRSFTELFVAESLVAVYEHNEAEPALVYKGTAVADVMSLVAIYAATFHVVANHQCEVDGSTASGTTYCLARHLVESRAGLRDIEMLIRYDDRYELTPDGWKFSARDIHRQWTVERPAERANVPISAQDLRERPVTTVPTE